MSTLTPSTIRLVVQHEKKGSRAARQTISRTADRTHIVESDGREWLFERNPVDPRRVSASLIQHAAQVIVLHSETDLRMTLGIRGWADVLTLGFDHEALRRYRPTPDVRVIDGIRFVRYVPSEKATSLNEVWWSDKEVLPSRFSVAQADGLTRVMIESMTDRVDSELLVPPVSRFPKYRVVDLADWLEKR